MSFSKIDKGKPLFNGQQEEVPVHFEEQAKADYTLLGYEE